MKKLLSLSLLILLLGCNKEHQPTMVSVTNSDSHTLYYLEMTMLKGTNVVKIVQLDSLQVNKESKICDAIDCDNVIVKYVIFYDHYTNAFFDLPFQAQLGRNNVIELKSLNPKYNHGGYLWRR